MIFSRWRSIAEVLVLASFMFISSNAIQGDRQKQVRSYIDDKLKFLNRHAVKSIQSPDGDIIDCVDIYKQPAFDHPALKNHTIQMRPSCVPVPDSIKSKKNSSGRTAPLQVWQRGGRCPKGTIPIRRVREQDLLRFDDLERFGRKNPKFVNASDADNRQGRGDRTVVINDGIGSLGPRENLSTAILVATVYHFIGSRASLNVWNPRVASPNEFTTSQLWLLGGGRDDFESVEAGWMVNPKLYGDQQTRLFAYWTSDGSKTTGCFDLLCSGFVQTSTKVALGAAIAPVSSVFGPQYEIPISIYMDNKTDNWWLRVNDIDLGYWPSSLFGDYLKSSATFAQWGGEVYSPDVRKSPHTTTAMGSGSFAEDLFNVACYIAHIRVMDFSYTWKYPHFSYAMQGKHNEKQVISNIKNKLNILQRHAMKSIQSLDGDIIDCVDIYKQPALDHPALKNHTIQMKPSYIPVPDSIQDKNTSNRSIPFQIWRRSGSCPDRTIPIRRIRKEDLLRCDDQDRFGRKNPQFANSSDNRLGLADRTLVINGGTLALGPQENRSSAIMVATAFHFVGARASLNVWNPRLGAPDEYSTSQIWLLGGGPDDLESVEAGWMVNPKLYGDTQTRLFSYWTSDGSKTTGCFDLLCSGFVQTSTTVALGAAINPVSSKFGPQYEIPVSIYMDKMTFNWWLRVKEKIDIGYWPSSLFKTYLKSGATLVQWGGEVYSPNVRKSPHTTTAMGSGGFAEDLFGGASYAAHVRVMDSSFSWKYPPFVGVYADEWNCYTAYHYVPGYLDEPTLFFGGPGQNPRCP